MGAIWSSASGDSFLCLESAFHIFLNPNGVFALATSLSTSNSKAVQISHLRETQISLHPDGIVQVNDLFGGDIIAQDFAQTANTKEHTPFSARQETTYALKTPNGTSCRKGIAPPRRKPRKPKRRPTCPLPGEQLPSAESQGNHFDKKASCLS